MDEQIDLAFVESETIKLSQFSRSRVLDSMEGLISWGQMEHQLHIRTAIVEYYNQLKWLVEEADSGRK